MNRTECGRLGHVAGGKFCTRCGAPLLSAPQPPTGDECGRLGHATGGKFCTRCGAALLSAPQAPNGDDCARRDHVYGGSFCTRCGTPLTLNPPPQKQTGMPRWLKIVLIVSGVLLGLGVLGALFGEEPAPDPAATPRPTLTHAPTHTPGPSPTREPTRTPLPLSPALSAALNASAVASITDDRRVVHAAITQDGRTFSLVVIVGFATNEEYTKTVGDNFVRMVKALSDDENPGKSIGSGKYDYIIGVYYPNEAPVSIGAKARSSSGITW